MQFSSCGFSDPEMLFSFLSLMLQRAKLFNIEVL